MCSFFSKWFCTNVFDFSVRFVLNFTQTDMILATATMSVARFFGGARHPTNNLCLWLTLMKPCCWANACEAMKIAFFAENKSEWHPERNKNNPWRRTVPSSHVLSHRSCHGRLAQRPRVLGAECAQLRCQARPHRIHAPELVCLTVRASHRCAMPDKLPLATHDLSHF